MNGHNRHLDCLDEASWREIVGRVIDAEPVAILNRQPAELLAGAGVGTKVFRVTGAAATTANRSVDWSLIVKVLSLDKMAFQSSSADPNSWDYWKREWHVYRSAWQQALPGPLVAPRCLGTGELAEAENNPELAWIAMEDVATDGHSAWPQNHFGTVARHVGMFNGRYLSGQAIPSEPWLSRDWLRGWTELSEPLISQLPVAEAHPVAGRIFTREINKDLVWLWEHRDKVYAELERLPQVLCHNDFFPRNVFVRDTLCPETVAIDWAYCGAAPIGQELSTLVGATLVFRESRPSRWDALERDCVDGYAVGLRDVGWSAGDQAFTGYVLSLVLRFGAASLPPLFNMTFTREHEGFVRQVFGCSYDEFVAHAVAVMSFLQRRIHQTKALLGL